MFSPCEMCKLHFNKDYSTDCDFSCDYAATALALKEMKVGLDRLIGLPEKEMKKGFVDLIDLGDSYQVSDCLREQDKNVDDSK